MLGTAKEVALVGDLKVHAEGLQAEVVLLLARVRLVVLHAREAERESEREIQEEEGEEEEERRRRRDARTTEGGRCGTCKRCHSDGQLREIRIHHNYVGNRRVRTGSQSCEPNNGR